MQANLVTSMKVVSGNEVIGTDRAWWFENVSTQALMF
jgi:hypothetical protein